MPATSSHLLAPVASTTSSGHADGLGRRTLAFDREEGVMLERLTVRPELAAFERMLRERVERVAALEDERIARPRTVERDSDGSLIVVSEFVPGCRLADLLEASADSGSAPGIDAAFGYLLDVLPALCGLHAGAGFAHGTIAPCRTVITPAGQVVLLDALYGEALTHLRYGRRKLWTEFDLVTPPSAGAPRLGVPDDVAQVVLSAVMLVLGRPLRPTDYPQGLSNVVLEVVDVAQIRGNAAFADRLLAFLQRALPVPGGRAYKAADDALIDLRDLATDIGLQACRRALVDCITQLDPSSAPAQALSSRDVPQTVDDLPADDEAEQDLDSGVDAEIDVEALVEESPFGLDEVTEIEVSSDESPLDDSLLFSWSDGAGDEPATHTRTDSPGDPPAPTPPVVEAAARALSVSNPPLPESAAAAEPAHGEDHDDAAPSVRVKRGKRSRTARSKKDKLRSSKTDTRTPAPPPEPADDTWLVPPGQAAAFEPAVPIAPPVTPPVAARIAPPPPVAPVPAVGAAPYQPPAPGSVFLPAAVAAPQVLPAPAAVVAPPVPPAPVAWQPTSPSTDPLFAHPATVAPHNAPLKFKETAPKRTGTRAPVVAPEPVYEPVEADGGRERSGGLPWKLGAAALALLVMGVAGARSYLPVGSGAGDATSTARTTPAAAAPAASVAIAGNRGRLEIETQPAGARVLLDGKPVGESPLTLDEVSPGRHTVTFISGSGNVKRTVRVEAGRTARLDVPIFSGWVGIYAPFVVEVSEAGRTIGTTEEPRLMLSPGRHVLTLTNRDLGYSSVETVDIEPGELRSVSLDPQGTASLNASPWAEVWLDGKKLGDTPIANVALPLGIRELSFRHPGLGERRVTVTVRGDVPATVSVDMTRPQQ